jgi:hypothetical protein
MEGYIDAMLSRWPAVGLALAAAVAQAGGDGSLLADANLGESASLGLG